MINEMIIYYYIHLCQKWSDGIYQIMFVRHFHWSWLMWFFSLKIKFQLKFLCYRQVPSYPTPMLAMWSISLVITDCPKWVWSGWCEQFLHFGLRKFRHSKSFVYWCNQQTRWWTACRLHLQRSSTTWLNAQVYHTLVDSITSISSELVV